MYIRNLEISNCVIIYWIYILITKLGPNDTGKSSKNKEEVIAIILGGRRRKLILCCYSYKYMFQFLSAVFLNRLVSLNIKNILFTIKFLLLFLQNPRFLVIFCQLLRLFQYLGIFSNFYTLFSTFSYVPLISK